MSINRELSKMCIANTINYMGYFSDEIKLARDLLGLTQEDVAAALGMRLENYNRVENGHRPISEEKLAELANILKLTPHHLLSCKLLDKYGEQVFVLGYKKIKKGK